MAFKTQQQIADERVAKAWKTEEKDRELVCETCGCTKDENHCLMIHAQAENPEQTVFYIACPCSRCRIIIR